MIKKINQTNKQTNKKRKKKEKKKKKKKKRKENKTKTEKKGPFHWLAVYCTIFHPATTLLFQNDCDWNGKSHSLSTRPLAMIYFGRVWGPHKNNGPFGLKNFWPNPTKITPFLAKKGTFCKPPWLRACFPLPPPTSTTWRGKIACGCFYHVNSRPTEARRIYKLI